MIQPKLPTAALGFVWGRLRLEDFNAQENWAPQLGRCYLLVLAVPFQADYGRINLFVTHIQLRSRFGFLIMSHEKWWHLCFHFWLTFRFKELRELPNHDRPKWIPESERVLYWRFGWSRYDAHDKKYVKGYDIQILGKTFRIPFGTWFGPGLHWD